MIEEREGVRKFWDEYGLYYVIKIATNNGHISEVWESNATQIWRSLLTTFLIHIVYTFWYTFWYIFNTFLGGYTYLIHFLKTLLYAFLVSSMEAMNTMATMELLCLLWGLWWKPDFADLKKGVYLCYALNLKKLEQLCVARLDHADLQSNWFDAWIMSSWIIPPLFHGPNHFKI